MSNDDEIRAGDQFERVSGFNGCLVPGYRVRAICQTGLYWRAEGLDGLSMGDGWDLASSLLWRRLPREAPTIEERRAALKVGDRITDPALLAVGMRVYTGVRPSGFDRVIARLSEWGITFADGGQFGNDSIQRGLQDWERVTFRGWAQEEPAIRAGDAVAMGPDGKLRKAGYIPAVKLDPRICDATQCEVHHDPSDPACVRARHRTPAAPHDFTDPYASIAEVFGGEKLVTVLCKHCGASKESTRSCKPNDWRKERAALEAGWMTDADRDAAHARALEGRPAPPAYPGIAAGLGGTVGPVLSRLR